MRRFLLAVLFVLAIGMIPHAYADENTSVDSQSTIVAPSIKFTDFTRGIYWPWERTAWSAQNAEMEVWDFTDKMLRELKEQFHVDAIWLVNIGAKDAVRFAELSEKYGIAVLPVTGSIYSYRSMRTAEAARKVAQNTVNTLGTAKGISAYILLDEPKREEVGYLEAVRAEIEKLDPGRPAIAVSMPRQTESVARQTKLPFLVTDCYPFFSPNSPNGPNTPKDSRAYYTLVSERIAEFARKTGKTSWMMPMAYSEVWGDWYYDENMNVVAESNSHLNWRMPTAGEMKWQVWQTIVGGNKGAFFFVLFPIRNPRRSASDPKDMEGHRAKQPRPGWPLFTEETPLNSGTALVLNDGTPTPQMKAMGEAFSSIESQRALIGRMQIAPNIAFVNAPFRTSSFVDPVNEHTIVAVINDNTDDAVTGSIRLLPKIETAKELITNSTINAVQSEFSTLSLTIGAGEGALLDIGKVDASITYSEDFSIQFTAGKFTDTQKVLLPVEWGLGYRVGIQTKADSATQGQLEYKMSQVAGDRKRMKERLFLIYDGSGQSTKNIELAASSDGEEFQPLSVDQFNHPIAIPQDISDLRFDLLDKSSILSGWKLIFVP